ncbi:MAG TPA: acyl-CoA dehydrogenase family protein [Dyadobacter sp.]|jgi:alkylation response protein AidB-like acyl-CoA dehydrogenase|nr:acyl-CoA dehydrogenase family protein [Dyadobacter sp.]
MRKNSLHDLIEKIKHQAAYTDEHAKFPIKEFEWIRLSGLLTEPICRDTMLFRQNYSPKLVEILKLVGSASLPVARILEGHFNALLLISLFGSPLQRKHYFGKAFDSNLLFSVWNTQGSDGVNITNTGTNQYRLTGSKAFCPGAGWIQQPLITGSLVSKKGIGWQMCMIPEDKVKEIKVNGDVWKPLGMRPSASFNMDFSGIVIDPKDLLGPCDSYYQQPYFSAGSLRFSAVQLGAAQALLSHVQQSLKNSGRIHDTLQKTRIAEIAGLVETGNLWVRQAAIHNDRWHNKPSFHNSLISYVNMTRSIVDHLCVKIMQLAERSIGVSSLMKPHPVERLHRDLTTYLRQAAPDAAMLSVGDYVSGLQNTDLLWDEGVESM